MGFFDKMKQNSQAKEEKAVTKVVGRHLEEDETIEAWIRSADSLGTFSTKLIAATNQRVLYIDHEGSTIVPQEDVQAFHYKDIESVSSTAAGLSTVQLVTGIATITLEKVVNPAVKPFVEFVNKKRSEATNQSGTTIINTPDKSVAEQLKEYKELLDMEIITQDEFDKKKAELLG